MSVCILPKSWKNVLCLLFEFIENMWKKRSVVKEECFDSTNKWTLWSSRVTQLTGFNYHFQQCWEKSISSQTLLVIWSQFLYKRNNECQTKNLTILIFHLFEQVENDYQLLELKDMWVKWHFNNGTTNNLKIRCQRYKWIFLPSWEPQSMCTSRTVRLNEQTKEVHSCS